MPGPENSSIVTFHKISIPAGVRPFFGASRVASSFGRDIFLQRGIRLRKDGAQIFFDAGGEWHSAMAGFVGREGLQPREGDSGGMSEGDWEGLQSTIRSVSFSRPHDVGRYGAEVRKRAKRPAGWD